VARRTDQAKKLSTTFMMTEMPVGDPRSCSGPVPFRCFCIAATVDSLIYAGQLQAQTESGWPDGVTNLVGAPNGSGQVDCAIPLMKRPNSKNEDLTRHNISLFSLLLHGAG